MPHKRPSAGTPSLHQMARNWPSPRAEDSESCGNHPGARDSLNAEARGRNWRTPLVSDGAGGGATDAEERRRKGQHVNLQDQARTWSTPTTEQGGAETREEKAARGAGGANLQGQARNWSTPLSNDGNRETETFTNRTLTLTGQIKVWPEVTPADAVEEEILEERAHLQLALLDGMEESFPDGPRRRTTPANGRQVLNPRFVEWLMGFPIGWTESEPSETPWFRWWRRQHSES